MKAQVPDNVHMSALQAHCRPDMHVLEWRTLLL